MDQSVQGRYRVGTLLGRGAVGETYSAVDLANDRPVVLKILRLDRPELAEALRNEFALLAGVYHPRLLRVHDFGAEMLEGGTRYFYSADAVEGRSLTEHARASAWPQVALPLRDALEGLAVLHGLGIRHGDIKADNILVDAAGRGVLIDLSCARPFGPTDSALSGTPGYVARELMEEQSGDGRADLYALGVTIRRLADSVDVPAEVLALAERLLRPNASERPTDVGEVLEALGNDRAIVELARPAFRAPKLIARHAELAYFDQMLDALLTDAAAPRALLIHGPRGVGRSRLLAELKWRAQLRTHVIATPEGHPRPVSTLLKLLGIDTAASAGIDAVLRAREVVERHHSHAVLVCDDALIDPAERDLALALLRAMENTDRFIFICSGLVNESVANPAVHPAELRPLREGDVKAWVGARLSARSLRTLAQITGGLPGYIHACLERFDGTDLDRSDVFSDAETDGVLDGIIGESFMKLDDGERDAVGTMAVWGGVIDEGSADRLGLTLGVLLRLRDKGWLEREGLSHKLTRLADVGAILRLLPPAEARALHRRAAEQLEVAFHDVGASPERRSELAAAWVRQLALAGSPKQAWDAALAGQPWVELRPLAWRAAGETLAAEAEDDGTRLLAAEIVRLTGHAETSLAILATLSPSLRGAEAARRDLLRAESLLSLGRRRDAMPLVADLMARAQEVDIRARAIDLSARAKVQAADYEGALDDASRGLELEAVSDRSQARLHESAGVAAMYLGRPDQVRDHLSAAEALHAEADRPRDRVRVLNYQAIADFRAADLAAAISGYRQAFDLAEQHGLSDLAASAALNLGTALQQTGDLGAALGCYERGLRLAVALGRETTEIALRFNLGNLQTALGNHERAQITLRRVRDQAEAAGSSYFAAAAIAVLGEIALVRGDTDEAEELLADAEKRFAGQNAAREATETRLRQVEIELARGNPGEAAARLRTVQGEVVALGARDLDVRSSVLRAQVQQQQGDLPAARATLEEGLRLARETGQRLLEGEIAWSLAQICEAIGAIGSAEEHHAQAAFLLEGVAAELPEALAEAFFSHPRRNGLARLGVAQGGAARSPLGRSDRASLPPRPSIVPRERVAAPRRSADAPTAGTAATSDLVTQDNSLLARFLELSKRINSTLSTSKVLTYAIDSAIALTSAERGFILLAGQPKAGEPSFEVPIARNLDQAHLPQSHLKFSHGIAARVIESGGAVVTLSAIEDPRFSGNESVHAMHLKSVVCVPIANPKGVLGAIYLDNRFEEGRFDQQALGLLAAFAEQVAIALDNARLHGELRDKTEKLEIEQRRVQRLLSGQAKEIDRLSDTVKEQQHALELRFEYGNIVGRSAAMREVLTILDRVTESAVSVLIQGESGTGKELLARALHYNGPRKAEAFVSINCAAIPESLLEAELFGHRRGAFTGADRDREGLFVRARGGTLFLDEIGELPLSMQAKLLRALQDRKVRPIGADREVAIDIRVVAATNRVLRDEVAAQRFREDLYFRLAVVELSVPSLRERPEDVPAIAQHVLERLAEDAGLAEPPHLGRDALAALMRQPLHGNVRELENLLARGFLMRRDAAMIVAADLGIESLGAASARGPRPSRSGPKNRRGFHDTELQRILAALEACRWNVSEVSRQLGIPRTTLYRRLKGHLPPGIR